MAGHSQLLPLCMINLTKSYDDKSRELAMVYPEMHTCPLGSVLRSSLFHSKITGFEKYSQTKEKEHEDEVRRSNVALATIQLSSS